MGGGQQSFAATYRLAVRFLSGRPVYTLDVAGGEAAARDVVAEWARQGGLWVIDQSQNHRVYVPWHAVTEVALCPTPAGLAGPASLAPPRPPASTQPPPRLGVYHPPALPGAA